MWKIIPPLAAVCLIASCRSDDVSQTKDIATDIKDNKMYLYYVEDEMVIQAECPPGQPPSRATCEKRHSLPLELVRTRLVDKLTTDAQILEREIATLRDDDARLARDMGPLLSRNKQLNFTKAQRESERALADSDIKRIEPKIAKKTQDLSDVEAKMRAQPDKADWYRGTHERITDELRALQRPYDEALATKRTIDEAISGLNAEIRASSDELQAAQQETSRVKADLQAKEAALKKTRLDSQEVAMLFDKLRDGTLTYKILNSNKQFEGARPFLEKLHQIFAEANPATSSATGTATSTASSTGMMTGTGSATATSTATSTSANTASSSATSTGTSVAPTGTRTATSTTTGTTGTARPGGF